MKLRNMPIIEEKPQSPTQETMEDTTWDSRLPNVPIIQTMRYETARK